MAHFVKLDDNNIVIELHVINNNILLDENGVEQEIKGIEFLTNWSGNNYTNWKQTSYNNKFRKRYAAIGDKYDPELDAFISPKPYPSWTLNLTTCIWEPPIPLPENTDEIYSWDETNQNWILVNSEQ